MNSRKTFGEILQEKRKAKGWSQNYLGKIVGVHQGLISNYELNNVIPSYLVVADFADVFNCSMDEMIGRSYPKKEQIELKNKIKQRVQELIKEIDKL